MTSTLARDLRRALLRALLLGGGGAAAHALLAAVTRESAGPAEVCTALFGGLATVPLSLVELRAARRPPDERGGAGCLVWILASLLLPLVVVQYAYVRALLDSGSPVSGLAAVERVLQVLGGNPPAALGASVAATLPLFLAAQLRLLEGRSPSAMAVAAGALTLFPLLICVWPAVVALAIGFCALVAGCGVADRLDALIDRLSHRREAAALEAAVEAGRFPAHRLRLLAHAGHEPARVVLGDRAPDDVPDLTAWVQELADGGVEAAVRVAVAVARAVRPAFEASHPGRTDARDTVAALEGWLLDRGPASSARARDLRAHLLGDDDLPARALVRALEVVAERSPERAAAGAVFSAGLAVQLAVRAGCDPEALRETIRGALVAWLLPPPDPPQPAPAR